MSAAEVISLDERRARYRPIHDQPVHAPMLRLVGTDEPAPARVFTLEVFLARASAVMDTQPEGSDRGLPGQASA